LMAGLLIKALISGIDLIELRRWKANQSALPVTTLNF